MRDFTEPGAADLVNCPTHVLGVSTARNWGDKVSM